MYLPAAELQQYKGFWLCPYCIMEMRDEDLRIEKYKPVKYTISPLAYGERCERCGKETDSIYIWNERRLCRSCLAEEQSKWGLVGGRPFGAPTKVTYGGEKESILSRFISRILESVGLRKRASKSEIVVAPRQKIVVKKKGRAVSIVAFERGRPLTERLEKGEEEGPEPEEEGLMEKKKKKTKKGKKEEEKRWNPFDKYKS